jgi:hypothetical protein
MKTPSMHPKMWCIWKPAQSGKTSSMQNWIRKNEETAEHLNILIASNNRLLVSQLTKRMTDDGFGSSGSDSEISDDDDRSEADDHIDEISKIYSWMSGSGKPKIDVGTLADHIKEDDVNMIVCCANKTRMIHIKKLLENLEKSKIFKKRISIWIDEADVSPKLWTKTVDFTKFSHVDRVVLVSATFDSVFKIYDTIRIKGYEEVFNLPTYLRYEECNITVEEENKKCCFDYLKGILDKNPEMSEPGARLFVPGEIKVSTHDEIADMLRARNFAVMVINGERKEIVLPDGTKIRILLASNIETPGELSSKLAELYVQHNLSRFPFAITGLICLGRGITFQSPSFMFSHGVIPDLNDEAAIYQCVARLLGNTKEFEGFTPPKVFCTYRTNTVCKHLANIAENIARIVHEKGWVDVSMAMIEKVLGEKPSNKELTSEQKESKAVRKEQEENVRLEEFENMKDLITRYKEIRKSYAHCKLPSKSPTEPQKDKDGKYKCSIGGISEVQTAQAIRNFARGMKSWGAGASDSKRGDLICRVYAGYQDLTPVLFLRWTYSLPQVVA